MGHIETLPVQETRSKYPPLPPEIHGTGPKKSHWVLWLVLLLIVGGGLYWYYRGSASAKSGSDQSQSTSGSGRGRGRGSANGPIAVVVASAIKGDMPVLLNGIGTVTPLNTVTIHSRVDGQLISVNFKEGQIVKAGEVLAALDPRPYQVSLEQAEGQYAHDTALLHDAQANFSRYQALWNDQVIAKQQLDTQAATVEQYQGALKTDQGAIDSAKLNLDYCRITAPITGRIGLRLIDPGNIVHASDSTGMLVITQIQPIAVVFTLPEDQLPAVYGKLRGNQQLSVDAYDHDNTAKLATGTLLTIDNQIDPTTGTYKLKSVFDNSDFSLFPNQFVNMHLLVDTRRNLSVVPTSAIQRGPQGTYVYVVQPDSTVKVRPVNVALTVNNNVGVDNGLNPGEVVVTDGQDKLQDGSKVDQRTTTGEKVTAAGTQGASGSQGQTQSRGGKPQKSSTKSPANGGANK
jgi:membrane fusion protein, multidrug efflux system